MGSSMPEVPDHFERMWADLAPVGRSAATGGYFRQPFASAERERMAWFVEQADARGLRDRDGVRLADAMADAGMDDEDPQPWLGPDAIRCFVELHVEQGRDLVDRNAVVGVASRIWPHGRYRFEFAGEPNHAGTTRMEDRRDPMVTYAMTALAA